MRVVFVSWRDLAHPNAGGSELVVDRLASGLVTRGHEVALLCGGPVGRRPYSVEDLGGTYGQYLRAPLVYARRFRHVDLLVDVENGLPFFSPLWRRGPILCLVHHVHAEQWRSRFPRPLAALGAGVERYALARLYQRHLFAAPSLSTARDLEAIGVDPRRIRVVHWGVDPAGPRVADTARPQFLVLGRLVPQKRVDLLLAAWERVQPQTGGRLLVVGDGPERDRLAARAGPGVEFLGHVSEADKRRLLGESWLLVHGARREGWGMVVLEAAAAGTPTLALDAPGIHDAVVDGVTGELAGSLDELVDRWIALARDPDRRQRLAEGARRRAASLSWESALDEFEAVAFEAVSAEAALATVTR